MPVRVDPTTAAARWQSGMAGAGQKYSEGIARVQTAPGAKAAAAVDKWQQGVLDNRNKFVRNSQAVSLGEWQNQAQTKGAPRLASGAQAAQPKYEAKIAPVLSYMGQVLAQVDNMPTTTLDQRIAKSVAFQTQMARYGK